MYCIVNHCSIIIIIVIIVVVVCEMPVKQVPRGVESALLPRPKVKCIYDGIYSICIRMYVSYDLVRCGCFVWLCQIMHGNKYCVPEIAVLTFASKMMQIYLL